MAFKKKKSGDSKLQDAAGAREEERKLGAKMDPKDHLEHVIQEVQDGAETKRAVGDEAGAARSEATMAKLLKALELMEAKIARLESSQGGSRLQQPEAMLRCSTCGQFAKNPGSGRGVCNGEHVMVMVAPSVQDLWSSFPGVIYNGVKYGGRHLLPKEIASNVVSAVHRWEARERKKFIPGGRVFGEIGTNLSAPGHTPII